MTQTTLHIDGDELAYGAALRCFSVSEASREISQIIESYKFKFNTDDFLCYLSCKRQNGFRRKINPDYKAKRDSVQRPTLLLPIKKMILDEWPTIVEESLEADDLLAMAKTRECSVKNISISQDKDLLSVSGWNFNPKKDEYEIFIDEETAYKNFLKQCVAGDSCDGIAGIPRMGKVAANKLVDSGNVKNLFDVASLYKDKGLSDEYFVANVRCVRLLHDGEYCFDTRKISYKKDKILLQHELK